VGFIAASGTGLQAVVCQLFAYGEGVSHAIGVGGRDVSEAVGGKMTLFALQKLEEDDQTEIIVIISKPPANQVLEEFEKALNRISKPVIVCCLGIVPPKISRATWVQNLSEAAEATLYLLNQRSWSPSMFDVNGIIDSLNIDISKYKNSSILGLYTGGTLAHESLVIASELLGNIGSNMGHGEQVSNHLILDLGDDYFTRGRPHPMIDPGIRREILFETMKNGKFDILFFDVVLGHGAADNPAKALADAVRDLKQSNKRAISFASIIGTISDPQNMSEQKAILQDAGIAVLDTNAHVAMVVSTISKGTVH
jgi:succinyl-CoA synthetase alpha subunit